MDKYTKKLSEQLVSLKENVAKYHKGEFTGWAVSHRFRVLMAQAQWPHSGRNDFLYDKEFTTCGGYEVDVWEL